MAIDGKRLRGANFLDHITHVVELFAAEDRLCLAVEKVPDKTVEKSTLPVIWIVDVIFEEDDNLMDWGHSAENMGLFRRLAMNIAAVADPERGLAAVRRAATFGTGYLKEILAIIFCREVSKNFS